MRRARRGKSAMTFALVDLACRRVRRARCGDVEGCSDVVSKLYNVVVDDGTRLKHVVDALNVQIDIFIERGGACAVSAIDAIGSVRDEVVDACAGACAEANREAMGECFAVVVTYVLSAPNESEERR